MSHPERMGPIIVPQMYEMPLDNRWHTYILFELQEGMGSGTKIFRWGRQNQLHADIAETFAKNELQLSEKEILDSNYLLNKVAGYKALGAGEFRMISANQLEWIAISGSYHKNHSAALRSLLEGRLYKVFQIFSDDE
jgi:hypothetical protein